MIRVNKRQYAWGDIGIFILGKAVLGVKGIEYKMSVAKEHNHCAGRDAYSIQHGKRTATGTLTLLQSEVIALNTAAKAAGYTDLLDAEIDIIVSYEQGGFVVVDKINTASFTELPSGMKEGDMQAEIALPFLALDIEYGV